MCRQRLRCAAQFPRLVCCWRRSSMETKHEGMSCLLMGGCAVVQVWCPHAASDCVCACVLLLLHHTLSCVYMMRCVYQSPAGARSQLPQQCGCSPVLRELACVVLQLLPCLCGGRPDVSSCAFGCGGAATQPSASLAGCVFWLATPQHGVSQVFVRRQVQQLVRLLLRLPSMPAGCLLCCVCIYRPEVGVEVCCASIDISFNLSFFLAVGRSIVQQHGSVCLSHPVFLVQACRWRVCSLGSDRCVACSTHTVRRAGGGLKGLLAWGGRCALTVLQGGLGVLLWMCVGDCWLLRLGCGVGGDGWVDGVGVYFIQGLALFWQHVLYPWVCVLTPTRVHHATAHRSVCCFASSCMSA
jgi:hypothetical protein